MERTGLSDEEREDLVDLSDKLKAELREASIQVLIMDDDELHTVNMVFERVADQPPWLYSEFMNLVVRPTPMRIYGERQEAIRLYVQELKHFRDNRQSHGNEADRLAADLLIWPLEKLLLENGNHIERVVLDPKHQYTVEWITRRWMRNWMTRKLFKTIKSLIVYQSSEITSTSSSNRGTFNAIPPGGYRFDHVGGRTCDRHNKTKGRQCENSVVAWKP